MVLNFQNKIIKLLSKLMALNNFLIDFSYNLMLPFGDQFGVSLKFLWFCFGSAVLLSYRAFRLVLTVLLRPLLRTKKPTTVKGYFESYGERGRRFNIKKESDHFRLFPICCQLSQQNFNGCSILQLDSLEYQQTLLNAQEVLNKFLTDCFR